jgi:hypothetical protein
MSGAMIDLLTAIYDRAMIVPASPQKMIRGDPLQNTPRALCCPSHGAMPTLGYVFLRTGLAMEEL